MMSSNNFRIAALCILIIAGAACKKNSDPATTTSGAALSSDKPSGIMTSISAAVATTGGSLGGTGAASIQGDNELHPFLSASACDTHGQPGSLNQSQGGYPGTMAYCKMTVNDGSPDTIQGGFAMVKSISCALESAGLTFDGAAHSISMAVNATCFTATQISNIGAGTMTVTATASKPAAFNTYFDSGISIDVPSFGTYKVATKISGTKAEFASYEDQSTTKRGTTYGSLDSATGELRYEARMERIDCTESGSCGWNRHIKLYADLAVSGSTLGDIESISFGYSNIQDTPGQSSPGGVLITAAGNLTAGIKARLWSATNGSGGSPTTRAHVQTIANWSETSNSNCYVHGSDTASTCGAGNTGMTSSVAFLLTGGSYTAASAWLTGFTGATFTTANVNAD